MIRIVPSMVAPHKFALRPDAAVALSDATTILPQLGSHAPINALATELGQLHLVEDCRLQAAGQAARREGRRRLEILPLKHRA